jgi:acetate kinase
MKILVLNSGSSSIKFKLFEMPDGLLLAHGLIERIGEQQSLVRCRSSDNKALTTERNKNIANHSEGLKEIMSWLIAPGHGVLSKIEDIDAVGHRVVHGAEEFQEPTIINKEVIKTIRDCSALAPLHNPANLLGVEVASQLLPERPQIAVFDTAFHQTLPDYAFRYAIPKDLYKKYKIRRYGFHGTSHSYVAKQAAKALKRPLNELNLLTIHLGNGASIAALKEGRSVDTSMGLTPLEGLVMGTRCGDLDPAIAFYLMEEAGLDTDEIDVILNKQSGLKGICGFNDMREVERQASDGHKDAALALSLFGYRIKKYIGAYAAALGTLDALVFTAGIGENSAKVRSLACSNLDILGIKLDPQKNKNSRAGNRQIQSDDSKVKVLVISTNEELEIAQQTLAILNKVK